MKRGRKPDWFLLGTLALLIAGYAMIHTLNKGSWLAHNQWDSYTLQAMAWREGHTYLLQNYDWLELAVYNGHYYVSFPPVPSVVMLPLTYIWGADTPNNLVVMGYALAAVWCAYRCFTKMGARDTAAMFWALFFVMGSNMLWMSTTGGVWFQAQGLNLALSFGGVWALLCGKNTLCLALLALAVGCRPFSICLLAAAFVYVCMQEKKAHPEQSVWRIWLKKSRHLILPACIGLCYCAYNAARFGNPLEFGHNYLPEFTAAGSEQFGLKYIWQNAYKIFLRPVTLQSDGSLAFPLFDGFMFFVANPIFLVWMAQTVRRAAKRQWTAEQALFCAAMAANLLLLLLHKTFGGWQFGARYTVDLLPYVLWMMAKQNPQAPQKWMLLLGGFSVLFNAFGALYMLLLA